MKVEVDKQIYEPDDGLMVLYEKHYGKFENSGTFVDFDFLLDVTKYVKCEKGACHKK